MNFLTLEVLLPFAPVRQSRGIGVPPRDWISPGLTVDGGWIGTAKITTHLPAIYYLAGAHSCNLTLFLTIYINQWMNTLLLASSGIILHRLFNFAPILTNKHTQNLVASSNRRALNNVCNTLNILPPTFHSTPLQLFLHL